MACSALRAFWRGRKRRSFPERRGSTAMPSGGYSFWKWEQEKEWRKESPQHRNPGFNHLSAALSLISAVTRCKAKLRTTHLCCSGCAPPPLPRQPQPPVSCSELLPTPGHAPPSLHAVPQDHSNPHVLRAARLHCCALCPLSTQRLSSPQGDPAHLPAALGKGKAE